MTLFLCASAGIATPKVNAQENIINNKTKLDSINHL